MGIIQDRRARRVARSRYRFDAAQVSPQWLALLMYARRQGGWKGELNGRRGGLRTYADQAALYDLWRSGQGSPAFHPNGPSRHLIKNVKGAGWRQAVDVSDPQGLIRAAAKRGVTLHTPYTGEPWHVEARSRFSAWKFR